MERKRSNDILLAILEALVAQRTWTQARLARHIDVEVRTLRTYLQSLERLGVEREEDGREVFISVRRDWLAGAGINLGHADILRLVRLLFLTPDSDERGEALEQLSSAVPHLAGVLDLNSVTGPEAPPGIDRFEKLLPMLGKTALEIEYETADGRRAPRVCSPQRLLHEPPYVYLVAFCHERQELRLFRLDRIGEVKQRRSLPFHRVDSLELDGDQAARIGGFREGRAPARYSFVVTDPDASWFRDSLPTGASLEPCEDGTRVTVVTDAPGPLARLLVGLGGSARIESPELLERVRTLARGALRGA